MPGWCVLTNSFARVNPLIGLTEEEYRDFACALVSYVALHATIDQTTYFMNLCRDYTREIAGKVAVANRVRRQLIPVSLRSALKKSLSH
jgi:hypothetical protein